MSPASPCSPPGRPPRRAQRRPTRARCRRLPAADVATAQEEHPSPRARSQPPREASGRSSARATVRARLFTQTTRAAAAGSSAPDEDQRQRTDEGEAVRVARRLDEHAEAPLRGSRRPAARRGPGDRRRGRCTRWRAREEKDPDSAETPSARARRRRTAAGTGRASPACAAGSAWFTRRPRVISLPRRSS